MRVVITGAAGRIGSQMVEELSGTHELCLIDRRPVRRRDSIVADLAKNHAWTRWRSWMDLKSPRWTERFAGADVVLHLAANASPRASWEQVLRDNIEATRNVVELAVRHHVRRVVFASSNWAVKALEMELAPACYAPGGPKIDSHTPPHPLAPYGLSKAMGELIGRTFVNEQKLGSFVAVRIGAYAKTPGQEPWWANLWIGSLDLCSLLRRCVEAKFEGFHVVYGVSAQPTTPYDLSYTRQLLSWEPQQLL